MSAEVFNPAKRPQLSRHTLAVFLVACAAIVLFYSMRFEPKPDSGQRSSPKAGFSVQDLIEILHETNPSYTHSPKYRRIWNWLPERLQERLPRPQRVNEILGSRRHAALALGEFGPAAAPAIPELIRIARNRKEHWATRLYSVQSLGQIGSVASAAVPVLRRYLTANPTESISALARDGAGADIAAIDGQLRARAALALAQIGVADPKSLPAIIQLLQTTNDLARSSAAVALWRLAPQAEGTKHVKALLLTGSAAERQYTIYSLSHFGSDAAIFVPDIRSNAESEEEGVRRAAEVALSKLAVRTSEFPRKDR